MKVISTSFTLAIRRMVFLWLVLFAQSLTPAYGFDESVYVNVGETFTVYTTYQSGTYSILWTYEYSVLEPVTSIGASTSSVTFRVKKAPSTGQAPIQATTYYSESGHNGKHTDFWTVYIDSDDPDPDVKITEITLDKEAVNCYIGKPSELLEATIYPSSVTDYELIWSSSNEEVAFVIADTYYPNYCAIHAQKCGTTTITCKAAGSGAMATCKVTVFDGEPHIIIAKTIEGVELTYWVEDASTGTCKLIYADKSAIIGHVTIPEIVEGEHQNQKGIEKLRVTEISSNVFSSCETLTGISIPSSVIAIGESTFKSCTNLTSINIPNSVTSIGNSAFMWCKGITSVTIPNSISNIAESTFNGCSSLTSVNIPDGITKIGKYAFQSCSNLSTLTLPNSVTDIEEQAFCDCLALTSVTMGNSVTSIGSSAFYGCSSLTSVIIPNRVETIGSYAFAGCSNLRSIIIPNSVVSIGDRALAYNTKWEYIQSNIVNPMPVSELVYPNISTDNLNDVFYPILFVPVGCKAIYQDTSGWKEFRHIVEGTIESNYEKVCDIDATNFPDDNFRKYLLESHLGIDGILTKMEIMYFVDYLWSLKNKGISSLKGIEYFTSLKGIDISRNQIKGSAMDYLIESLPTYTDGIVHRFDVYNNKNGDEGNVCTKAQVEAIKAKGWLPRHYNGSEWVEYEGSDDELPILKGDVNDDGEVNGTDLVAMANMILGKTEKKTAADLNGDGEVNGTDYVALVNIVLGKK